MPRQTDKTLAPLMPFLEDWNARLRVPSGWGAGQSLQSPRPQGTTCLCSRAALWNYRLQLHASFTGDLGGNTQGPSH